MGSIFIPDFIVNLMNQDENKNTFMFSDIVYKLKEESEKKECRDFFDKKRIFSIRRKKEGGYLLEGSG